MYSPGSAPHYAPDEIEAVLEDGTHLHAAYQHEGQRLGFERTLPIGTLILLDGIRGWVVGSSECVAGEVEPTT